MKNKDTIIEERSTRDESFTEILFLTRELRFAVSLIQSAMEETELFGLVINDPSALMFLMLASQGVERLLKLVFLYDTIIMQKKDNAFSPKKYGHNIMELYKDIDTISIPEEAKEQYKKLFIDNNLISQLFNIFGKVLEDFNSSGRYYFTSKETREKKHFYLYFDEALIGLVHDYQCLTIFDKKHKYKRYKDILKISIEEAKMMEDDYEKIVPEIFCRNIGEKPIKPYWNPDAYQNECANDDFKKATREFLLLFISPIITILESQFMQVSELYNVSYYFSELTNSIKFRTKIYEYKKHRRIERDYLDTILL